MFIDPTESHGRIDYVQVNRHNAHLFPRTQVYMYRHVYMYVHIDVVVRRPSMFVGNTKSQGIMTVDSSVLCSNG